MTQDLYYYESGYLTPDSGYFVYTADAESAITSTSNISCDADLIAGGVVVEGTSSWMSNSSVSAITNAIFSSNSILSSQFTQSTTISHIHGADLFAMGNAALDAQVSRIRDNNIAVSSAFTISTSGQRIRYVSSEEDSAFTLDAVNLRVRYNEAAIDAAFSLSNAPTRIQDGNINVNDSFTQVTDGDRVKFATVTLDSSVSITAIATRIIGGDTIEAYGDWTSNSSLTAIISHIEGADLSAFSNASISVSVDKFSGAVVSLNCASNFNISILKIQTASVSLVSNTSLSANAILTVDLVLNQTSNTLLSASALRIQKSTINLSGAFSPTLSVSVFKNSFAVLDSSANISVITIVNKSFISSLTSTSILSTTVQKLRTISVNLTSAFTLSAPYLSFKNKRPYSLYYVGSPYTGAGITNAKSYAGTYSYYTGSGSSSTRSLQIANTSSSIGNNEDFIITARIFPTSMGNASGTASRQYFLQCDDWALGVWVNGGLFYGAFYYKKAGDLDYTLMLQPFYGFVESNQWNHYKITRINGTINFELYNPVRGTNAADVDYYTGAIDGPYSSPVYFNAHQGAYGVYYDEVFFAKGTSSYSTGGSPNGIWDGALPTTQWLFNFENGYQDQTFGRELGAAQLTSAITSSITAGKNVNPTLSLTSNASLTNIISRTKQFAIAIQSSGSLLSAISRIRPFVDIEVATFTLNTSVKAIKPLAATINCTSTISCEVTKSIGVITANLNSTSSLITTGDVTSGAVAHLEVNAFELIANGRIRAEVADLNSSFTLTALVNKSREASAQLNSVSAVDAVVKKIVDPIINLSTTTSLEVSTIHTVPFTSTPSSQFSVNCNSNRIRGTASNQTVTSQLQSTLKINKTFVVNSSALAIQVANNTRIRNNTVNLTAFVSELTLGNQIRNNTISLASSSSLQVVISILGGRVRADLVSQAIITITANRIRAVVSNQIVNTQLITNAGKRVIAQAILSCQGFVLSTGRKINLNDVPSYIIPAEIRTWVVPSYDNIKDEIIYVIPSELRNWIIPQESNLYVIEFENRSYKIKG